MKVGDYVRTKDGILWKPEKIEEIEGKWFFDDYYFYDKDYVKSSSNIIDLIEEGDYVNGHKVIYTIGNINKRIYVEYVNMDELLEIKLEQIASIVTKEQFENCMYKVGD